MSEAVLENLRHYLPSPGMLEEGAAGAAGGLVRGGVRAAQEALASPSAVVGGEASQDTMVEVLLFALLLLMVIVIVRASLKPRFQGTVQQSTRPHRVSGGRGPGGGLEYEYPGELMPLVKARSLLEKAVTSNVRRLSAGLTLSELVASYSRHVAVPYELLREFAEAYNESVFGARPPRVDVAERVKKALLGVRRG